MTLSKEERLAEAEAAKARLEERARAAVDAGDAVALEGMSREYFAIIATIKSLTDSTL